MKTIQIILTNFLLFIAFLNTYSQKNIEIFGRTNLGIGAEYKQLEFENPNNSGTLLYSPGGGSGIELGIVYPLLKNLEIYGAAEYHMFLAMQYYKSNYDEYKSSFQFSRSSFIFGTNLTFAFSETSPMGIKIGGGGSYNVPGKMTITELNIDYGDINFNPEFGYHIEASFYYAFSRISIIPSIRYRNLIYHVDSYRPNTNSPMTTNFDEFPDYIKRVNATGCDFSLAIRYKLKK